MGHTIHLFMLYNLEYFIRFLGKYGLSEVIYTH